MNTQQQQNKFKWLKHSILLVSIALATQAYAGLDQGIQYYETEKYSAALKEFKPLASQGDADARMYLGLLYEFGEGGLTKDVSQAIAWYEKAAAQGQAHAQFLLGEHYKAGDGVSKNISVALNWYKQAANQDHEYAIAEVAKWQEFEDAQKKAQLGDADALYVMAENYHYGRFDLPEDDTKARALFEQAAQKGNTDAQLFLGTTFRGDNAEQEAIANDWLKKAFVQGNADAAYALGFYNVPPESEKSWNLIAAELGHGLAQHIIGTLSEDPVEQVQWLEKAAFNETNTFPDETRDALALIYAKGDQGVARNEARAYCYFASIPSWSEAAKRRNTSPTFLNLKARYKAKVDCEAMGVPGEN